MSYAVMPNSRLKLKKSQQLDSHNLDINVPATNENLVILAEKLTECEVPLKVLLQALSIAAYDHASAFRYAEQYLKNGRKSSQLR